MISVSAAQWHLITLLIGGITRGLKLALKAADNIKKVRAMTVEQVDNAIKEEEGRSERLEKELDES
jgi:hypothetical protein